VLRDATAVCWGNNADGELGDKTTTSRGAPVAVAGLSDVAQVAVGVGFSCARLGDGQVKCWGRNDKGQLGLGTPVKAAAAGSETASEEGSAPPSPPQLLSLASRPASLSLGETHGCAVLSNGSAQCWGDDTFGQLGRGDAPAAPAPKGRPAPAPKPPAPVKGLKDVAEIALGDAYACARIGDGTVACWGDDASGQLGDGSSSAKATPVKVSGLSDVAALAVGRRHACALLADGGVRCWGENASGQLGDGSTERRTAPVEVSGLSGARSITSRGDHTCVSLSSGALRCWGANGMGQIGDGSSEKRPAPAPVAW
jgi:alpha-tubulin suppressor-like RCC1 family protein